MRLRIGNLATFWSVSRSGRSHVVWNFNQVLRRSRLLSALLVVCLTVGSATSNALGDPPELYTFGQSYTQATKTVSTTVFVWYPGQP